MLLEPDLTFLPQKRLRLICLSSMSLGFTRLIKTVNTTGACPLSLVIYIGIHILSSRWGLGRVLPRALQPSQSQVTAYPMEHQISPHLRKENSPQRLVGCRLQQNTISQPLRPYSFCPRRDTASLWYSGDFPRRTRTWSAVAPSLSHGTWNDFQ